MGILGSILVPMAIAFIGSYLVAPKFIRLLELEGIVGTDVQKKEKPKVAEMGAPIVLFGFLGGIFAYIGAQTFLIKGMGANELVTLLAVISTLMIITFIGVIDELTCLIKEREGHGLFEKFKRKGLSQWMQVILPLPAAIPLMAISAGVSTISIPLVGTFDIGILYPLILVPLAIVGTSNATNMLAGFNGLQAGLGIVMMLFLGSYAYLNGSIVAAVLAFVFMAALFAFLRYNWYPAKVFPGGLDYLVGTMIGCIAVVGNMEKFAVICFAPWFLELLLKARSRFRAENFGMIQSDGTLKAPDSKINSVTHIVMRLGRFKEWQVSLIVTAGVAFWCSFVSLMFWLQALRIIL
jgi:UDP-N-acetylglucosamine--dolichyl-phosphate N-acetylglucosaminephosphotransferase